MLDTPNTQYLDHRKAKKITNTKIETRKLATFLPGFRCNTEAGRESFQLKKKKLRKYCYIGFGEAESEANHYGIN